MAKTQDGMDGSYKMSPRKGMAMGKISVTASEDFGTKSFDNHQGHSANPDRGMGSDATSDGARGMGPGKSMARHGPMGIRGLGRPRG